MTFAVSSSFFAHAFSLALAVSTALGQDPAQGAKGSAPASRPATSVEEGPAETAVDDELLLHRIEVQCEQLRKGDRLRALGALREGADGRRCAFDPTSSSTAEFTLPDLRERLLQSVCIVGQYFRCTECDGWHASASTGFAVAVDGLVATCFHLLEEDPIDLPEGRDEQPEPYLFVADWKGRVFPVDEIAAADAGDDVMLVRCGARDLVPLPLRPGVRTGETVVCLSNPDHWFAVMTQGIVARRYLVRGGAPGSSISVPAPLHSGEPTGPTRTFLQVTCDFAGGSSGAPLVDCAANVLGIAQSTSTLSALLPGNDLGDVQMVARTAVPVEALLRLRAK